MTDIVKTVIGNALQNESFVRGLKGKLTKYLTLPINEESENSNFFLKKVLIPVSKTFKIDSEELTPVVPGITIGPIYKHLTNGDTDMVLVDGTLTRDLLSKRSKDNTGTQHSLEGDKVYLVDRSSGSKRDGSWSCVYEYNVSIMNNKIKLNPTNRDAKTLIADFSKGVIGKSCPKDNSLMLQSPPHIKIPDPTVNWLGKSVGGDTILEVDEKNAQVSVNGKYYVLGVQKEPKSMTVDLVDKNSNKIQEYTGRPVTSVEERKKVFDAYANEQVLTAIKIAENILTEIYLVGQTQQGGQNDQHYKHLYEKYKKKYLALK